MNIMKRWLSKMNISLKNAKMKSVKVKDVRILILIIIFAIIFHIGYDYLLVDGDSMSSTYKEGDKLFVNKITYKYHSPERGDIIVFYDPWDDAVLIKRIVALPYETVEIIDGVVLINDKPLNDHYSGELLLSHTLQYKNEEKPRVYYANTSKNYLKSNEYYAIGDNRDETWFGIVLEEYIIGQVAE